MNNISEAQTALMTKPVKATTYERVTLLAQMRDRYAGEPQPIRFGRIMRDFLSEVSTPLFSSDLIAGRHTDRELSEEEEAFYQQFLHDRGNLYCTTIFHCGHTTLDWDALVENGIVGLRRPAVFRRERNRKRTEFDTLHRYATAFFLSRRPDGYAVAV